MADTIPADSDPSSDPAATQKPLTPPTGGTEILSASAGPDDTAGRTGPSPSGGTEILFAPDANPGATVARPRRSDSDGTVIRAPDAPGAVGQQAETRLPPHDTERAAAPGDTVVGAPPGRQGSDLGRIPGYELLAELGRGAMGVVYRARDVRLDRVVALKMVLSGGHAGAAERARFFDEARAIASLQHPNVVQVFEVGEVGELPFCALEYVPGGTLAGALKGVPQEPRLAAWRAQTLARAMAAVHAAGVIHRDLKPANVLLTPDGVPKVTDFGLAKRVDDAAGRTQAGQVLGTPSYMAPEQASGDAARIGPLSDVWALGAVLYEMLTGRPPFRAPGVWDTIALVLNTDPVPPRRLQPGTPRDLETICLKCLEKEPGKRYPSAAALADDLGRYLDGRAVLARRAGSVERTVKWARRSPLQAVLAGAIAACSGLLAGVLVLRAQHAEKEAALVRTDADLKQRELDEARRRGAVRDRFSELLAGAEHDAATAADAATWDQVARSLRTALQLADGDPAAFAGWPLQAAARELLARADGARAAAFRRDAVRARVVALGEHHGDAVFHATLATGLGLDESVERVRKAAADGLGLFGVTPENDGPPQAEPGVLTPDEARAVADRCYELLLLEAELLARPVPGERAEAWRGRVKAALARLDRADRLLPGVRTRAGLTRRAECLTALQQDSEAKAVADEAAAIAPVRAADHFLTGLEAYRDDDFGRAVPALAAALRAEPGHFGAQYLLAVCHLRLGQPQEAKVGLTRCLAQRPGFVWPKLLRASAETELARRGLGDYAAARADLDAVLQNPPDESARYAALTNRGATAVRQQDWAAAVADLSEAVGLKPDAVPAYLNLALAHRQRAAAPPWRGDLLALAPLPAAAFALHAARTAHRDDALAAAVATLDTAVEKRPNESRLYHERGQLHLLRGDLANGRADLVRAIALAPNLGRLSTVADDLLQLGRALHDGREYAAAARAYAAVLEMPPERLSGERRATAARLLAEPLLALGKWPEAAAAIDQYLALVPVTEGRALPPAQREQVTGALKARGLICAQQKDMRAAVDSYTRALALARDPEVLSLRGWAYLASGAAALGEQDFDEILRRRPNDPDALLGRADARVRLGFHRDAAAAADVAIRGIPDVDGAKSRARLRFNAARVYAEVALRDPDPAAALERTAEQLKAALADTPADERAEFWKNLVQADPALARLSRTPVVRAATAELRPADR
jgi:tetratricopeptide (TPR) repeat protein